jgi:Stage II sporulation protein E (SpoIIE)
MAEISYTGPLRILSADASADLGQLLGTSCTPACDPVVYLADYSRHVLYPLTDGIARENVEGTLPGRAFTTGEPAVSARDGHARVWVPVLQQTARVGVLAVTLPDAGPDSVREAELLGVFAGLALAGMDRVTDTQRVRRHGRSLSLPASMQWDLLPPWGIRMPGALVAAVLEPAYDVAGDAYDYAAGDGVLHFAVIDGMGHGIGSTLLAGLAVGAYRHARRAAAPLQEVHATIDQALAGGYDDLSFATGLVGTLTAATGRLEWTCAGHPPPLLLRGRKVVAELRCEPTVPFGLGTGTPVVSSRDLEPDDAVLLYTDGVTEAHAPGDEPFGLGRLVDLLERESAGSHQPEELLRRLVRAVIDHQGGTLRDDATMVLLRWAGPAAPAAAGDPPGAGRAGGSRWRRTAPGRWIAAALGRWPRRR